MVLIKNIISIFLVLAYICRIIAVSEAQYFTPPYINGGGRGGGGGGIGSGFLQCFSSFLDVEGCGLAAFRAFIGGQRSSLISPECCSTIAKVGDDCWPKIFPMNPLISSELRTICCGIPAV